MRLQTRHGIEPYPNQESFIQDTLIGIQTGQAITFLPSRKHSLGLLGQGPKAHAPHIPIK